MILPCYEKYIHYLYVELPRRQMSRQCAIQSWFNSWRDLNSQCPAHGRFPKKVCRISTSSLWASDSLYIYCYAYKHKHPSFLAVLTSNRWTFTYKILPIIISVALPFSFGVCGNKFQDIDNNPTKRMRKVRGAAKAKTWWSCHGKYLKVKDGLHSSSYQTLRLAYYPNRHRFLLGYYVNEMCKAFEIVSTQQYNK